MKTLIGAFLIFGILISGVCSSAAQGGLPADGACLYDEWSGQWIKYTAMPGGGMMGNPVSSCLGDSGTSLGFASGGVIKRVQEYNPAVPPEGEGYHGPAYEAAYAALEGFSAAVNPMEWLGSAGLEVGLGMDLNPLTVLNYYSATDEEAKNLIPPWETASESRNYPGGAVCMYFNLPWCSDGGPLKENPSAQSGLPAAGSCEYDQYSKTWIRYSPIVGGMMGVADPSCIR